MLIDGKKYACEACVKGHRVSKCRHTDRPLQHIQRTGRPRLFPESEPEDPKSHHVDFKKQEFQIPLEPEPVSTPEPKVSSEPEREAFKPSVYRKIHPYPQPFVDNESAGTQYGREERVRTTQAESSSANYVQPANYAQVSRPTTNEQQSSIEDYEWLTSFSDMPHWSNTGKPDET